MIVAELIRSAIEIERLRVDAAVRRAVTVAASAAAQAASIPCARSEGRDRKEKQKASGVMTIETDVEQK